MRRDDDRAPHIRETSVAAPRDNRKLVLGTAVVVVACIVLVFLLSGNTLFSGSNARDPYILQADGFLERRVDLPAEIPRPRASSRLRM
jgi:hypothetical protein